MSSDLSYIIEPLDVVLYADMTAGANKSGILRYNIRKIKIYVCYTSLLSCNDVGKRRIEDGGILYTQQRESYAYLYQVKGTQL